jgi:hypothetical protein
VSLIENEEADCGDEEEFSVNIPKKSERMENHPMRAPTASTPRFPDFHDFRTDEILYVDNKARRNPFE